MAKYNADIMFPSFFNILDFTFKTLLVLKNINNRYN